MSIVVVVLMVVMGLSSWPAVGFFLDVADDFRIIEGDPKFKALARAENVFAELLILSILIFPNLIVQVSCGESSSENCTYFISDGNEVGQCRIKICPCSDNICQLRLDFPKFDILYSCLWPS